MLESTLSRYSPPTKWTKSLSYARTPAEAATYFTDYMDALPQELNPGQEIPVPDKELATYYAFWTKRTLQNCSDVLLIDK